MAEDNVVQFRKPAKPKDDEDHHGAGEAKCFACNHKWAAVAPIGNVELECPECHRMTGKFEYGWLPPAGNKVWSCACGCQMFYLTPIGFACPSCGRYRSWEVLEGE